MLIFQTTYNHLNDSSSIVFHPKNHSISKSNFRKILVENTTLIANKIDKLRLQTLEALHITPHQKINRINFENSDNVLKCFQYFFFYPVFLQYSISVDSVPCLKQRSLFKYISYPVLSNTVFPYFCYGINFQKLSKLFSKNKHALHNKQPEMMVYEGSESARDNFGKFIYRFQLETKTLIRKLKRVLNELYRQNQSFFI